MKSRRGSGRDVRFIARPPPRSVRAAFPHTACMGLSLSRVHHAIFVVLCCFILCSTRAASIVPSGPKLPSPVAHSDGQGRRLFSAAEGLSLTDASTAASYRDRVVRRSMIRGEPAIGHEQSHVHHACIRLNPYRVLTMKQLYASAGKAPRRRVHSPSGIAAIAVCGLPLPRIVIDYRASRKRRCRTYFSFLVLVA
jgi:hypothetical protein